MERLLKRQMQKIDLYAQTLHYGIGAFEGIRSYETPEGTKIFKSESIIID